MTTKHEEGTLDPIERFSLAERWAAVDKAIDSVLEHAPRTQAGDSPFARAVMKLLARLAQHRPRSDKPEEEHPAVALLRELEWAAQLPHPDHEGSLRSVCVKCWHWFRDGHAPGCKLAALIGKQPKGNDDGNNDDNGTT